MPAVSGIERLAVLTTVTERSSQEDTTNILTLVADSLQVGAACLARLVKSAWQVAQVYDYAGIGLQAGRHIPEDGRDRLFTRFGTVAGSRTWAGHVGTGLGLYLSRRSVEAMGGDLDLEATGLEGSTFRLRLKDAPVQREASPPTQERAPS